MSIKSTHYVTRDFAIKAIEKKISEINNLSDDDLEELLEDVIHNGFYNFSIVSEEEVKTTSRPTLTSTWNLPCRNDAW